MEASAIDMNKTTIKGVFRSQRFRTPAGAELESGLWCDRIGEARERLEPGRAPANLRVLGLHAAVGILSGKGFFESPLSGRIEVNAGDALYVRPEEPCSYWPEGEWKQVFVVWGGPESNVISRLLISFESSLCRLMPEGALDVAKAYEGLSQLMELEDPGSSFARKIEIEKLVLALSKRIPERGSQRIPEAVRKAMELLAESKDGESGRLISSVAKDCGLSQTHFRRLFKSSVGRSPKDFAMSLRLSRAKGMLGEDISLKETARACGFSDVSSTSCGFSRRPRE